MGNKNIWVVNYIDQIIEELNVVISYTEGLSYEEFINDSRTVDATMFRLQQMIEKTKNLSLEFKEKHSEIPWGEITGFRNRIVHEYGKTDYTTVYEIITKDIYELKDFFVNQILKL